MLELCIREVESTDKKDEQLKYEIAAELGLFEKVRKLGWKSLTAKETGRIGGLMTKRKKMLQVEKEQQV